MRKTRTLLVTLSFAGLVSGQSAVAGAPRTVEALPVFSAQVIANADQGDDSEVRCLKVDRVRVKADEFGQPILDAAGKMIPCRPVAGGFEWGALAGLPLAAILIRELTQHHGGGNGNPPPVSP